MEELSIEEKAKAYDKALNIAKEILDHTSENYLCTHLTKEDVKDMYIRFFPELKESEDERIKKEIIDVIQHTFSETSRGKKKWIAWLEKQGKSSDQIHYWTEEEIEPIISDYLRGAEHYGGMIARLRCLKPKSLEKQSETYTKRDVDDAWLEGMCDAKRELEKQSEQKPFDYENANIQQKDFAPKVEPKFKVGDWVVYYRNDSSREILQVYDIRDGRYYFTDNVHFSWSVKECDEKSHLWTIQDAKDGDVLYCENSGIEYIVMNNGINKCNNIDSYFEYNSEDGFDIGVPSVLSAEEDIITPATKEQCELLFQKMKEAGYEWDADKKELKKIDARENLTLDGDLMEADCMIVEQKSTWTKEDDVRLQACIDALQAESLMGKVDTVMTKWLKSIKDRVHPQTTWKPSDEQMADLWNMLCECRPADHQLLQDIYYGLKKLRENKL